MALDMTSLGSILGYISLLQLFLPFLPREFKEMLELWWNKLLRPAKRFSQFQIPQNDGSGMSNDLYRMARLYLGAADLCTDADELVLSRKENEDDITYNLADGESVVDTLEGVKVWWMHSIKSLGKDDDRREESKYVLKMHRGNKNFVMNSYLPCVINRAMEHRRQLQQLYLYSNNSSYWECHTFKHPSTFDTLAMEPSLKARVKSDLRSFVEGQKFFRKVGRPWKRGYLLFGPPGTGKSSMIAAMANHLKYNVYDLELTQVYDNSMLKQLLVNTTSKSIIVIEDIDCSLELSGQRPTTTVQETVVPSPMTVVEAQTALAESRVTLSGLLNFTDGLWSCCGDERIIVFTTNHVEKLDPALLRPGRMDMHIHMSYCCFETFRVLSANYLSIDSHPLYDSVRSLLDDGVLITPAQVTEILFGNKDDPIAALEALIARLKEKPAEDDDNKKTGRNNSKKEEEEVDMNDAVTKAKVEKEVDADDAVTKAKVEKEVDAEDAVTKAKVEKKVGVDAMEKVEEDVKENRHHGLGKDVPPESVTRDHHVDQRNLEGKPENGADSKNEYMETLKEIVGTLKENGVSLEKIVDGFAKVLPEAISLVQVAHSFTDVRIR